MRLSSLPLAIVELVKAEATAQGITIDFASDPELRDQDVLVWANTSQGYRFWETIEGADFSEFYSKYPKTEVINTQTPTIMQNQATGNLPLVQQLQELEATGKVRVIVKKEVRETHYKTRDLDKALEKQVVMNIIHTIPAMEFIATVVDNEGETGIDGFHMPNIEEVEIEQPRVLIDILIIGLDNKETIQKKINIAKAKLAELSEIDRIIELRQSDNILDCMEGYFGEGNRIEIQAKNN